MTSLQSALLSQYSATLQMLENAIRACPAALWASAGERGSPFGYMAVHTLFYVDLALRDTDAGFAPPPPFGLTEIDPSGVMPERVYTPEELLAYLEHGRRKARATIAGLTEESAGEITRFRRRQMPRAELLIYNLRHVQHHVAQLNLLLRQRIDSAPQWVAWDPHPTLE